MDVPLGEIRYALATRYHIDHAGLAQELKLAGVSLLVLDVQVPAIPLMKQRAKPQDQYVDITTHDNVTISTSESRSLLDQVGIAGEVVHTPGHSDDSVSLLLDDGSAFTGDLTHPLAATEEQQTIVVASTAVQGGAWAGSVGCGCRAEMCRMGEASEGSRQVPCRSSACGRLDVVETPCMASLLRFSGSVLSRAGRLTGQLPADR